MFHVGGLLIFIASKGIISICAEISNIQKENVSRKQQLQSCSSRAFHTTAIHLYYSCQSPVK